MSCDCVFMKSLDASFKHDGFKKSSEKTAWRSIRFRCYNERGNDYARYGGRGIFMCAQWTDSFSQFLKDMGPKPSRELSIDRINNEKGYCPHNCRWATKKQQAQNRLTKNNPDKHREVFSVKKKNGFYIERGYIFSRIQFKGKNHYLGTFKTIELAREAFSKKFKEFYGFEPNFTDV